MLLFKNSFFKESLKYLGWLLLFIFLWLKGCSNESKQTTKVKTPEVKGVFETKKPEHIPAEWPKKDQEKPIIQWKDKEIPVENPVNIELAQKYVMAKDSIERLNLYLKAIQLNKFSSNFEDENLSLNINGIVRGEVQEITPNYTIKAKEIPQKETTFRLLSGIELGNNTKLDNFSVKGNLMFQNRKGNIISTSFDTQQTIWVGYNFSIFSIKK
jgi:hypothetical protein